MKMFIGLIKENRAVHMNNNIVLAGMFFLIVEKLSFVLYPRRSK
jgi:hypothetical protein